MRGELRLNLGCGRDKREDFVNVDIDRRVGPDVVADLRKKFPFGDETAREVLALDVLEHLTLEEGEGFLAECFRVLIPEGKFVMRVAYPEKIIENFGDDEEVRNLFLYGDTAEKGERGAHKAGYSKRSLAAALERAGFDKVRLGEEETNLTVLAEKGRRRELTAVTVILQDAVAMGGAEFLMMDLVWAWQKMGVRVKTFTILRELIGRMKVQGLLAEFVPFRLDVAGDWKGLIKFFAYLPLAVVYYFSLLFSEKRRGSQVVVSSGFSDKMVVTPLAKLLGMAVVWVEFGPLEPLFLRNFYVPKVLYRLVKYMPDRVITLARSTKKSLVRDGRVSEAKIAVVPGGVVIKSEREVFGLKRRGKALAKKLGVAGKVVVGNISRAAREKGQWDLITIFAGTRAAKEGKAVLVLAGEGPDLENLRRKVVNEKLEEKVKILGWWENKWEFYGMLDVFVFPSGWNLEGFGMVMCEAMMCEVPVVGVDSGPVPEVVEDGRTGFVVGKEKMGEAIDRLVFNLPLRRGLGEGGRQRVEERFELDRVARSYVEEMEKAIAWNEVK